MSLYLTPPFFRRYDENGHYADVDTPDHSVPVS